MLIIIDKLQTNFTIHDKLLIMATKPQYYIKIAKTALQLKYDIMKSDCIMHSNLWHNTTQQFTIITAV